MKKVGDMKLYSFEELLEEDYGKVGTPERDAFERSVDEAMRAFRALGVQVALEMKGIGKVAL